MLKRIILGIFALAAIVVVGILALAATRPDNFHVERKAMIGAPPGTLFAAVNDFRRWTEWSPWEKLDPEMKRTFTGPESGVNAAYEWSGNNQVGKGKMTIIDSRPNQQIDIRLEFLEPWATTNQSRFSFQPTEGGTVVTWTMNGNNNFMSKVFTVFMDLDQVIGRDFEEGLASLKVLAENAPAQVDTSTSGTGQS